MKKKIVDFTLADVAEMTDVEVLQMSMPRPGHPEQQGFLFPPQTMPDVMAALIKRLANIRAQKP